MFSLNNYLNESLQSTTLYREILNEPGGLFRYFQMLPKERSVVVDKNTFKYSNNHNLIGDAQKYLNQMGDVCHKVFGTSTITSLYKIEDCMKKYNLSIEQVKKYNKEYNALVWKYIKAMSHIFDYPHPRVFGWLVNTDYDEDLYNITDDHFKKMTYKECRDNKEEFNDICASNRYTVFWFDGKTKQLLAISRNSNIIQFGTQFVDTTNYSKRHAFPANREHLDRMAKKEYLISDIRVDMLPDGTKLDWYYLSNNNYGAKQYGYNYLNSHGMIFPRSGSGKYSPYVIGNPFVSTSPIRNKAGWDKDGYVIIYMPEEFMKDDEDNIKGPAFGIRTDYNSWKAQNSESRNEKRRDYAISTLYRKYKWNKDEMGNIIPYTIDGEKYTFEFDENGKAIATPIPSNLKYADAFNLRIRQKNVEHYRYLVKQRSSNKEVILFSKSIKDFSNKALKYLEKVEAVEDNYLNAKEITLKYVENIQNHINGVLYEISRLKRTLEDFEAYLKEREDEDASEAGTTKGIQRYMDKLQNGSNDINAHFDTIDKLMDTNEIKKLIEK